MCTFFAHRRAGQAVGQENPRWALSKKIKDSGTPLPILFGPKFSGLPLSLLAAGFDFNHAIIAPKAIKRHGIRPL